MVLIESNLCQCRSVNASVEGITPWQLGAYEVRQLIP